MADSVKDQYHIYTQIASYKSFLEDIRNQNAAILDKQYQKQYCKIINEKDTDLLKRLNEKQFLFDNVVYPYLSTIFNNILEKNGFEKNKFHFFVNRTAEVNAYTYEDGTVVCDLGLLSIIQNESQLTMVFCHELGHYLLKHANASIIKNITWENSQELADEVKDIKRDKYNTKTELQNVLITDVFDSRKHNRFQEAAADSLGMILFCKTNYNSNTVPHLFDLLDSSEIDKSNCTIQNFFKNEGTSLDEDLFVVHKKMSFGKAEKKEIVDSLKTHPDCAIRKITAQAFFNNNPRTGADFIVGSPQKLADIKTVALFDEAGLYKDIDHISFYLYLLIQNDAAYPSNKYIKTEIFNTLLNICVHQKNHNLYKIVRAPYITEDNKDEYDKLLKVLDAESLDDLVTITKNYYQKNKLLIAITSESLTTLNQLQTTHL